MRILMINDSLKIGGVETYLSDVKRQLEKKGHRVRILSSDLASNNSLKVDYSFKHINPHSKLRIFPYLFNMSAYKNLKKIIKEYSPDIVHLHFIPYHSSPSVLFALKNIPTVYTTHSHELYSPLTNALTKKCKHEFDSYCMHCLGVAKYFPDKFRSLIMKQLLKHVDRFIAPSKHHLSLLNKHGYTPATLLHNGVNLDSTYQTSTTEDNLLYVGRLTEEKGVEYAILALKTILKKNPHASLTILGIGPAEKKLKDLVKELKLTKSVTFKGYVSKQQLRSYFMKSSLVLVPSIYPESFVLVGIEAMSMGKPVIASRIGGIPEWLDNGKTGYLVEPKNAEQIAEKVNYLFSHKDVLKRMGIKARKKAETFSIENHTDKLEKIYKEVRGKYKASLR